MIALSHKTRFSHVVLCVNDADAHTLFDRAQAGDTLHNVGEFREDEAEQLMYQIGTQLSNGQYKRI